MILHVNHTRRDSAVPTTSEVVETLLGLLEEGSIEPAQYARLQIHLDWIQYRHNFREPVSVTRTPGGCDENAVPLEIRIDGRQVVPGALRELVRGAVKPMAPERAQRQERVYLEDFCSFRRSLTWQFNRLYWTRLKDWEQATGRDYEKALPGGQSDAHHPQAIADTVGDFWTLLKGLQSRNQLPEEIFVLEMGVGTGTRAGMWLDRFLALDQQRETKFYPRLRFLLGDYSLATLERSRAAVGKHLDQCSFIALDALDPIRTLSFLRHKILHVHSSNMYDNLPDEEIERRDGRIYWVQVRAYLPAAEAARIGEACEVPASQVPKTITRLLDVGPECLPDHSRGVEFWREIWGAMRLEERIVGVEELEDSPFPAALNAAQLEDILGEAPSDLRFHLSSGALESFRNTLPLLHPRGYLQVQDIFVTDLNEYSMGFHGPGKLEGSIVNWVNGALLREVAERAGFDLHFAPFNYRPGSRTSVLYTTQRE